MIAKDDVWVYSTDPTCIVKVLGVSSTEVVYLYTAGFYIGDRQTVKISAFQRYFTLLQSATPPSLVEHERNVLEADPIIRKRDEIFRRMFGC